MEVIWPILLSESTRMDSRCLTGRLLQLDGNFVYLDGECYKPLANMNKRN